MAKAAAPQDWTLLPHNARRLWRRLLDRLPEIREAAEASPHNRFDPGEAGAPFAVLTSGIARHYFAAEVGGLAVRPPTLHVGVYPAPAGAIRRLAATAPRLLVVEEGYPFLERQVRGVLPSAWEVLGKESGQLPLDGELTPDLVRAALGLPSRPHLAASALPLPGRPPQLCRGCPHADSYEAVREALASFPESVVTSDIGCYTLGALPPYSAIESCVCMGASVGMAKGAADAGLRPALAVIGDSTFLHSGVTPLMDAVAAGTPMTLLDPGQRDRGHDRPAADGAARLAAGATAAGAGGGAGALARGGGDAPPPRGADCAPARRTGLRRGLGDRGGPGVRGAGQGAAAPGGEGVKYDLVLAGVGGQGVLSVAAILAEAARRAAAWRCARARCTACRSGAGRCRRPCGWPTRPSRATWWPGAGPTWCWGSSRWRRCATWTTSLPGGRLVTAADPYENVPDYPPDRARCWPRCGPCRGRCWSRRGNWRGAPGRAAPPTW